jgi:hypothetical protein
MLKGFSYRTIATSAARLHVAVRRRRAAGPAAAWLGATKLHCVLRLAM